MHHSIILDINNFIYSIGDNTVGQLGLGHKNRKLTISKINISNVKCINCCYMTSYALLINGECLSFGDNTGGQSGHPKKIMNTLLPTPIQYFIDNNIKIIQIKTGWNHAVFISNNNLPYLCGKILFYSERMFTPRKFDKLKNDEYVIQTFSRQSTIIFVSNYLNIYIYGENQLFVNENSFSINKIYKLTNNWKAIVQIIPICDEILILQY